MNSLHELYRHNAWANARVFKVTRAAESALLETASRGTFGTINSTLSHMAQVEEGFAALIAGATGTFGKDGFRHMVSATGLEDGYADHELAWFGERVAELDEHLKAQAGAFGETELAASAEVPWLGLTCTVEQMLVQVLVHNAHHRSQVFSALGEQGVRVPDLDYVVMLAKERAAAAP